LNGDVDKIFKNLVFGSTIEELQDMIKPGEKEGLPVIVVLLISAVIQDMKSGTLKEVNTVLDRVLGKAGQPEERRPPVKRGRKTKYKPEYCDEMIQAAREGKSAVAWITGIGISFSCLYNWQETHPDFKRAVEEAKAVYESWYERFIVEGASGRIKDFNATAAIWLGKNKCKWRDQKDKAAGVSVSVSVDYSSELSKLMDSEKARDD
jgi:transposase